MLIEGTLPDTWGEEYKADLNSVTIPQFRFVAPFPNEHLRRLSDLDPKLSARMLIEGGYTDLQIKKIRDAVDWCIDDIKSRYKRDPINLANKRNLFLGKVKAMNKAHGIDRIFFVTGHKREPVFDALMDICVKHGYKGDTNYAG